MISSFINQTPFEYVLVALKTRYSKDEERATDVYLLLFLNPWQHFNPLKPAPKRGIQKMEIL
jgi:hypothetical protein